MENIIIIIEAIAIYIWIILFTIGIIVIIGHLMKKGKIRIITKRQYQQQQYRQQQYQQQQYQQQQYKQQQYQQQQYQQQQYQQQQYQQQQYQQQQYRQQQYQQQYRPPEPPQQQSKIRNYQKKLLLTKNECNFYKKLRVFADKHELQILAKIRLADIVEPKNNSNRSEWYSDFGKIKSKHVDFALCNKDNLYILCLIELDDNSHKQQDRIKRDQFVDNIYKSVNIPIIHTNYYNDKTEKQLCSCLGLPIQPDEKRGSVSETNI